VNFEREGIQKIVHENRGCLTPRVYMYNCPNCGKNILKRAEEDSQKLVVRVRFLKIEKGKGEVYGKCQHCGGFTRLPFMMATI